MSDREGPRVRAVSRTKRGGIGDASRMSPAERIRMVWQLTLDAWAFKEGDEPDESRLQRHAVRLRRRGG